MRYSRLLIVLSFALILTAPAAAEMTGYGIVKSYGEGRIVIVLAHSTGTWRVDEKSVVKGPMAPGDWVYVEVETSGHIKLLRWEETPAPRAGVVKEVHGNILVVRSGNGEETWNVTPETILNGIERGQFQPGDGIGAKLYKNHNLAELTLNKRGIKI
jgi:hypothetical protein